MKRSEIQEIKELLSIPKNVVLVPHKNPDGDAMGASLAMYHFLMLKGHLVTVVSPNDYPDFLKWLPGSKNAYKFDMQNRQSKSAIDQADIIFLLDFNALHRVGDDMQNTLEKFQGDFIMIDHHQQPDDVAKYLYSDTSICSTCQMVYQFIDKLGELNLINKDIAICLYTGIMTDTGSFRFPSTTSKTHRIIADLIDKGADNAKAHNNVYDTNSYGRLQLLGRALSNMVVIDKLKTDIPELPDDKKKRFIDEFKVSAYEATILVSDIDTAKYFEEVVAKMGKNRDMKLAVNWITGELFAVLNNKNLEISESPISAKNLAKLINLIKN